MEKKYNLVTNKVLLISFLLMSFIGNAQHFTATLDNFTSTTNTFEVDVVLVIDEQVRLSSFSTGIYFNPAILNGGTPCTTVNCGSWHYIPGSRSVQLAPLNATINTFSTAPAEHLKVIQTGLPGASSVDLAPGVYVLGRYRFTNTVSWAANTDAQLWLSGLNAGGSATTVVAFYPYGYSTPLNAYSTTTPLNGAGLTLGYTQASPMLRILNGPLSTVQNIVNPLQVTPNPFYNSFQLDFESVSNEQITVKVYDMIGKVIDNRVVEATTINTLQIGENYQSGIYNVVVSQGDKSQNVRVIKR